MLLRSPILVFCSVIDPHGSNKKFLEDMSDLALRANCKLIICPLTENQGDRWIQVGSGADPGREWGWPGRPEPRPSPGFGEGSLLRFLMASVSREEARPPGARTQGGGHKGGGRKAARVLCLSRFLPNALVPDSPLLAEVLKSLPSTARCPQPPTPPPPPPRGRILFWKTILRSLWSLPLSSQDEMEFGYVEAPHKSFPVVFDSPRDRGLKDFAKKILVCSKGRKGEP